MHLPRRENIRFWIPVLLLLGLAGYSTQRLVRMHIDPVVDAPDYFFTRKELATRGTVYGSAGSGTPLAKSIPVWMYYLDPVALTNSLAHHRRSGETRESVVERISEALGLERGKIMGMMGGDTRRSGYRYQFLGKSSDREVYAKLADSKRVFGVAISGRQERLFLGGRSMSHVVGSVNAEGVGSAGIEQRFNPELSGTAGTVMGMRDAHGRELYDKRKVSVEPIRGEDIYLTVDNNLQYKAEVKLREGIAEYGAATGWCIIMDSRTGAILAMASQPDFEPTEFGKASESARLNRAIGFTYEPGSVMKVITAAGAIDAGFVTPNRVYSTNRNDPRYFRLPGDGSHQWEPTMTVSDAIVHSSNIVIGKLGYDFGPRRLYEYMRRFGFGEKTGIELPGEEKGLLHDPQRKTWDKATWSRAAIGQSFSVTALQLASAYQAIANDGVRMRPYIVDHITREDGTVAYQHEPREASRPISAATAKTMRSMMLGVASPAGTARRAAIPGYSVAGKTGTAQKPNPNGKGYLNGLYRATFCGIVPASEPRLVILVTLDFEAITKFHQGGNSAGPIFKGIAKEALSYLMIPPDRPDELLEME